jgi:hypothetical protein
MTATIRRTVGRRRRSPFTFSANGRTGSGGGIFSRLRSAQIAM